MHIDVHIHRLHLQKQRARRIARILQHARIRPLQRAQKQLVPDRAVVDKQILRQRIGFVIRRQADEPRQFHPVALAFDLQRILRKLAPHDFRCPPEPCVKKIPVRRRQRNLLLFVNVKVKRHFGVRQRNAADNVRARPRLGAVRFQELQPRRRRKKQIPHLNPRPPGARTRPHLALRPAFDFQLPAVFRAFLPRRDFHLRHRGNRRQRLAAKPQKLHIEQIVRRQLGRRVPFHRQRQVFRIHAFAVVLNRNQRLAPGLERYLNPRRPRVQRVLHQLLDRRRRAFDNLARRNLVD